MVVVFKTDKGGDVGASGGGDEYDDGDKKMMMVEEMHDPDITMEEYVQLETERALKTGNSPANKSTNDALASKLDFLSEPTVR
ncbi:hypothetical protein Tco_0677974 [Tanacetum coccineum]|uniref:Uncharacterized protein n=1 Tax=Tanacetum coccineum TaxID=301880 RepID=A0ABQ4XEF8_9ASTR